MELGYNTNGLPDVNATQAIDVVHSIGYDGISLSVDCGLLNPLAAGFRSSACSGPSCTGEFEPTKCE